MTPPCCFAPTPTYRAHRPYSFPLGGKLSPQVTDEGLICGNRPFPQLGMRSPPPYTAISPQSSLPHPYPINVRARRALRIYYLLSFIYYLFCPAGALSSPMVHLSAISREIAIKKPALLPPLICTFHSFPRGLSRALKTPHWGVFAPRYAKRGARAVLVPDGAPIRSIPGNCNKKTALRFP